MIIKKSPKLGLKIIFPRTNFKDFRGMYLETFNKTNYKKILNLDFVEDDFSINKKKVFKGIHGDSRTWKLVSCVYGKCEAIVIDCNNNSRNFGNWEKFILSSKDYFQILIPPKYGNSFLVLSDFAVYHYKQTKYYRGEEYQFTYNYLDPKFKIKLSCKNPLVSKRDKKAIFIENKKNYIKI
jgi:dTDP-4-dehydrorhamnose 3,5-epimerase